MLKAILFDLDNTLILFDEAKFYQSYFREIKKLFADIIPADQFAERTISAIRVLVQNNGEKTNAEFFKENFAKGYEEQRDVQSGW